MHPGLVEEEMSAFKLPYTALKTSFPWNMSPWLVLLEVVLLVVLSIDAIEMEAEVGSSGDHWVYGLMGGEMGRCTGRMSGGFVI